MEAQSKTTSIFRGVERALFVAGITGVVADLATPIAPAALYVLAGSMAGLALVSVWSLLSRTASQLRVTLMVLLTLLAGVSGGLLYLQLTSDAGAERGVLASNVEPLAEVQNTLFGLSEEVARIGETTDRIDVRTQEIDQTTRETRQIVEGVKRETSEDPRKEIANIGREWNQQAFQIAVNEKDLRAVELYLSGGMSMNGTTMKFYLKPYYLRDDVYDPAMADLLVQSGRVGTDGLCVPSYDDWDFFQMTDRLPLKEDRQQTLRELCATPQVQAQYDTLIAAAEADLAERQATNADVDARRARCAAEFAAANPVQATIEEASRFSIFSVNTLRAPRDVVLAELNGWLLAGGRGSAQSAYDQAVAKGCADAHRVQAVSDEAVRKIRAARDVLFP